MRSFLDTYNDPKFVSCLARYKVIRRGFRNPETFALGMRNPGL